MEDPDDPDGGYYVPDETPAKYLYFGNKISITMNVFGIMTYANMYDLDFSAVEVLT